ncbi:MAG: hypothetical protein HY516_00730 [Candidatus Aenigmarchaeota archaeon]|nr:hypothetical protein [Candidatus Aenigmarchaeota archaeon]
MATQRPGSVTAVNNLIKEGFSYLRSGGYQVDGNFFKRGLSYLKPSRYTQKRKPAAALAAAAETYSRAAAQLNTVEKPADGVEKQRYDNAISGLEMLKSEVMSYGKHAAKKIDDETAKLVSRVGRAERRYERGRKILGVPYWRRPSSGKVERKIFGAWREITGEMDVTDISAQTGKPTGSSYITRLLGDLKSTRLSLEKVTGKELDAAEGKYFADIEHNLLGRRNELVGIYSRFKAASEGRAAGKTQKKENKETRKLEKEGKKDFERHMKAVKRHRW